MTDRDEVVAYFEKCRKEGERPCPHMLGPIVSEVDWRATLEGYCPCCSMVINGWRELITLALNDESEVLIEHRRWHGEHTIEFTVLFSDMTLMEWSQTDPPCSDEW